MRIDSRRIGDLLHRSIKRGELLMKRLGPLFGLALFGTMAAGCESGIKEGAPAEMPAGAQTDEFKNTMKTAGEKMQRKGMRKGATSPGVKAKPAP
jgi:hypothetical protein